MISYQPYTTAYYDVGNLLGCAQWGEQAEAYNGVKGRSCCPGLFMNKEGKCDTMQKHMTGCDDCHIQVKNNTGFNCTKTAVVKHPDYPNELTTMDIHCDPNCCKLPNSYWWGRRVDKTMGTWRGSLCDGAWPRFDVPNRPEGVCARTNAAGDLIEADPSCCWRDPPVYNDRQRTNSRVWKDSWNNLGLVYGSPQDAH
jgi:hypothetical protein